MKGKGLNLLVAMLSAAFLLGIGTAASAPVDTAAQQKLMMERAQASLSAQQWTIYMTPSVAQKRAVQPETDVLTFANGKVRSQNLSAKGYAESNYTVTLQNDGGIVWETMQVNEKVGLVFLRGELSKDGVMKGVISMQPQKGGRAGYNFSTVMQQAAPSEVPAEPAPKKKGRR